MVRCGGAGVLFILFFKKAYFVLFLKMSGSAFTLLKSDPNK